jgi:hypothetical protein
MLETGTSKYMQISHRIPSSQLVAALAFGAVSAVRRPLVACFCNMIQNLKIQLPKTSIISIIKLKPGKSGSEEPVASYFTREKFPRFKISINSSFLRQAFHRSP